MKIVIYPERYPRHKIILSWVLENNIPHTALYVVDPISFEPLRARVEIDIDDNSLGATWILLNLN